MFYSRGQGFRVVTVSQVTKQNAQQSSFLQWNQSVILPKRKDDLGIDGENQWKSI